MERLRASATGLSTSKGTYRLHTMIHSNMHTGTPTPTRPRLGHSTTGRDTPQPEGTLHNHRVWAHTRARTKTTRANTEYIGHPLVLKAVEIKKRPCTFEDEAKILRKHFSPAWSKASSLSRTCTQGRVSISPNTSQVKHRFNIACILSCSVPPY